MSIPDKWSMILFISTMFMNVKGVTLPCLVLVLASVALEAAVLNFASML